VSPDFKNVPNLLFSQKLPNHPVHARMTESQKPKQSAVLDPNTKAMKLFSVRKQDKPQTNRMEENQWELW